MSVHLHVCQPPCPWDQQTSRLARLDKRIAARLEIVRRLLRDGRFHIAEQRYKDFPWIVH